MGFWARYSAVLLLWTGFLGIATRLEASSTPPSTSGLGTERAAEAISEGSKRTAAPAALKTVDRRLSNGLALDLVGRKNAFVPAPPSGGGVGVIKSTVKILSSVFYEATIGAFRAGYNLLDQIDKAAQGDHRAAHKVRRVLGGVGISGQDSGSPAPAPTPHGAMRADVGLTKEAGIGAAGQEMEMAERGENLAAAIEEVVGQSGECHVWLRHPAAPCTLSNPGARSARGFSVVRFTREARVLPSPPAGRAPLHLPHGAPRSPLGHAEDPRS